MSDSVMILDHALELGHQELGHLAAGEVEKAEQAAHDRGRLIALALAGKEDASGTILFDKLSQLKNLQGQLTEEARRLHASLKGDLLRIRQESHRLSGYGKAAKVTPIHSRFVSKKG